MHGLPYSSWRFLDEVLLFTNVESGQLRQLSDHHSHFANENHRIMSKQKGMSADEKAAKLLGWFHSTQDFFSLKEIEKAGAKATGISGMIIKDVLQTLLDDSLVNCEKIGSGNYYWSYPQAAAAKLATEHKTAQKAEEEATKKLHEAQTLLADLKKARGIGEQSAEEEAKRAELLKEYYEKQAALEHINTQLSQFSQGDPAVYEKKKADIAAMQASALRWTDNISTMISYARDNFNMEPSEARAMLDLPEDYEDLAFSPSQSQK